MQELWEKYSTAIIIAGAILLIATNPTASDFKQWAANQPKTGGWLGNLISTAVCDDVETSDYYLFSFYQHCDTSQNFIGILGGFYSTSSGAKSQ